MKAQFEPIGTAETDDPSAAVSQLPTEDADYLRRELRSRGLRKAPEVVIYVCRRLAQGSQSKEKIAEALGIHPLTVDKIKGMWEKEELNFLRSYVFGIPRLVRGDDHFREWLAGRIELAIDAVQRLKDRISAFPWYDPDASAPRLRLFDTLHQMIIDGIRARSAILLSLESQWQEIAEACLTSASSLREQFAARLGGCAPPRLERQWAKVLVVLGSGGLSGLEFGLERVDGERVHLRFGAFELARDVGVDEARTFQDRFVWLLTGATALAQELQQRGTQLRVITGHIGEVLDQQLQL